MSLVAIIARNMCRSSTSLASRGCATPTRGCAQGKPWGFQGSPPSPLGFAGSPPTSLAPPGGLPQPPVIDPPYVAQRQAACDVPESACAVKARRLIKPCWFRAYLARPGAVCMANPPRWPR